MTDIDPIAELAEVEAIAARIARDREKPTPLPTLPDPNDEYRNWQVDSVHEFRGIKMQIRLRRSMAPRGWSVRVDRQLSSGQWDECAMDFAWSRRGAVWSGKRFFRSVFDHHMTWGDRGSLSAIKRI